MLVIPAPDPASGEADGHTAQESSQGQRVIVREWEGWVGLRGGIGMGVPG